MTHPNDVIYLFNQPQTFVAFGAPAAGRRNHEVLELPANDHGNRERSDHLRHERLRLEKCVSRNRLVHSNHNANADFSDYGAIAATARRTAR
jgi:hypothetical protein